MRWLIRAYTLILLAYTGWRTWDFMSSQLPDSDAGFWLAVLFLFATEIGLVLWHEVSINHTSTAVQYGIATWMTWIDFFGSLGAGIADMIIRQTMTDYTIPSWLALGLMFGMPLIVAVNVGSALVFLANDAESQLDREQRFLVFEATRQAIKDLKGNRSAIAREKKKEIYERLRGDALLAIDRDYVNKPAVILPVASTPPATANEPNPTKRRQPKSG